jgi:hypothetical protein
MVPKYIYALHGSLLEKKQWNSEEKRKQSGELIAIVFIFRRQMGTYWQPFRSLHASSVSLWLQPKFVMMWLLVVEK